MGQEYSQNEFDIVMAKFLVNECLSNDYLYYKFNEPIKKLDDNHFEELFKGNTNINYKIENNNEFSKLVLKFEDYSKLLYQYHRDQSKYDDIVILWKENICIFELYALSEEDRIKKFKDIGISGKFKYELNNFLNNTIESKTEGIVNYIKENFQFLYSIITFSTNEEKNLLNNPEKDNNKGTFSSNLSNIINGLILCGLPIMKNYLNKIPNLDLLSKQEIKNDSFLNNKLKDLILKIFKKDSSNSKVHQTLLDLTKNFKNSKEIAEILSKVRELYYDPMVSIIHLALSFLNLVKSINSFNECRNDFKKNIKIFSRELSQIYSDFLKHKEELPNLDIYQTEESIKKIREIDEKVLYDKFRLIEMRKQLEKIISKKGLSIDINRIVTKEFDIVYMIDATGSMKEWINAATDGCINISKELKEKFQYLEFYFGAVFYRDPIDSHEDKHEVFDLTDKIFELKENFGKIKVNGGGDDPEDWVGAYNKIINDFNWKDGTRLVIHIADAPAHTKEFCGKINHENENGKLPKLLKLCAEKNIKIISFSINEKAKISFNVCEKYYNEFKGFYKIFNFNEAKSSTISKQFTHMVLEAVNCAAPKKEEIWE